PLLEAQFRSILDGNDALAFRNKSRKDVEKGGFAAAGAAGHQDVQPSAHARAEKIDHFHGQRFLGHEILRLNGPGPETPNRHQRAIQCQWRDDGVDAAAIRQSAIDHGTGFVNAAAGLAYDTLDDVQEVLFVVKGYGRQFQHTVAFHINRVVAVD